MDTNQSQMIVVSRCYVPLVLLFVVHILLSHGNIEARSMDEAQKGLEHEGTVKTIVADHGEIIDCVDIYKQPSLKHPLIKDIKMKPSSYPRGMKTDGSRPPLLQDWQRFGECPQDTIPIRRTIANDGLLRPTLPFASHGKKLNPSRILEQSPTIEHRFAAVGTRGNLLQSVQGIFSVWSTKVEQKAEFSSSQISVANDVNFRQQNLTTIQAGFIVYPKKYNSSDTRFFIYWQNDENVLGCYDYECPGGFVQTTSKIGFGSRLVPVSTYGNIIEADIFIYQDLKTKDWWLQFDDITVGYWDSSMFPNLRAGADLVTWGGEVVNLRASGRHTTTQMGSGTFPQEGFQNASYIRAMMVRDFIGIVQAPRSFLHYVSNPGCYDVLVQYDPKFERRTRAYYGGPGYSTTCP